MNTPQDSHSGLLLCAFADEGEKERSIWYSCAVRAELWHFVCVCGATGANRSDLSQRSEWSE